MIKFNLFYCLLVKWAFTYVGIPAAPISPTVTPFVNPLRLSYTYTASTDCFTGQTATILSPFTNIYKLAYQFNMPRGI